MIILLHSSKTMRAQDLPGGKLTTSCFKVRADELAKTLKQLSEEDIAKSMKLSPQMAKKTRQLLKSYKNGGPTTAACEAFLGDIYSGLQAKSWNEEDKMYAQQNLRIISGLYGILRPLDGIQPYRLEMGYNLPLEGYSSMYNYWGPDIALMIPIKEKIINLLSQEYAKAVIPHLTNRTIISPRFLTLNKAGEPKNVAVHAKIVRGAYANWLIQNKIDSVGALPSFKQLGYFYQKNASTQNQPVYHTKNFKGLGLSIRKMSANS